MAQSACVLGQPNQWSRPDASAETLQGIEVRTR
jgi:hypothetical protein